MKLGFAAFAIAGLAAISLAQEGPRASAASERYHKYREAQTEPPFGLQKVKRLIKSVDSHSEEGAHALPAKTFGALTVPEKFTYVMLHGENFSQMCDVPPAIMDENKKIFAEPMGPFEDEESWSERQIAFMKQNRPQVIGLIRSTIGTRHRAGMNLKAAIVQLNATEMIPDLVALYNRDKKDGDILSVLMVLMKQGRYKPFIESASYRKLYGKEGSYQAYIVANDANKKLIIDRAQAFYKTRV